MSAKRKYQKAHNVRTEGFVPTQNPEQAEAMRLLRRSSAAGKHDSRPRRQRTRAAARRAAIHSMW